MEMKRESLEDYKKEIRLFAEEYSDRIKIYTGREFDRCYEESSHAIRDFFGGYALSYARSYCEPLVDMAYTLKFGIVDHFDVMTKF